MTKKQNLNEQYKKFLEKEEPERTKEEKQGETNAYKHLVKRK